MTTLNDKPLVNRVASSGLITLNLEDHFPTQPVVSLDLKQYLYMELMLKEKDFRTSMKEHDWAQYEGKNLVVFCSSDAIVPVWAYMLVAACAAPYAVEVFQGTEQEFYKLAFQRALDKIDGVIYTDQRIVVKGCSDKPVPPSAYAELTKKLQPYAKSIMYGEPCSTVPIYKKPRK